MSDSTSLRNFRHARDNSWEKYYIPHRWPNIWRDRFIVPLLMLLGGLVHSIGMFSSPSLVISDDEGTYVAQAWAILNTGQLAHYTYWYDHPPAGWIQMAVWAWLTRGFERYDLVISVGREFMLVTQVVSIALIYILAKRLGMNRAFAIMATLMFSLSPLAVYYHRLVFLDNIVVPWLLAAFVLVLSPKNRLSAYFGSALCFGVAVLTKETAAVILPALWWLSIQSSHPRTRRMANVVWLFTLGCLVASYPVMALIKNELLPGPGHVDLWTAIRWQLFDRGSSGSIFVDNTAGSIVVHSWARLDVLLIGSAIVLVLPAMFKKTLRPIAAAYALQVAMMLRPGGYLPLMYVIMMLPLAAIVTAGVLHAMWDSGTLTRFRKLRHQIGGTGWSYAQAIVQIPAVIIVAMLTVLAGQTWSPKLGDLLLTDHNQPLVQAIDWIESSVPTVQPGGQATTILVSDAMWTDLKIRGFSPDWYYKVDLDPAVKAKRYPNGWQSVNYAIFTNEMAEIGKSGFRNDTPTVFASRDHGTLVARFGSGIDTIWIYRVDPQKGIDSTV